MKGNTKNIQNYFKTKRISFKVKFCSSRLRTVVMQRREKTKYNRKQKRFSSDLKVGWRRGWGLARSRCRRGATRWWWATRRWRTAAAPRSSPSSPRCSRLSGEAAEWTKSSTLSDTLWSERDLILCHTESVVSCLPCHIHISLINNLKKYTLILLRPISHLVMALQQFYALRLLSVPGVESDRSCWCGRRLLVIQVQGQLLFLFRGCHQKSRVGPGGMVDHVVRKADHFHP